MIRFDFVVVCGDFEKSGHVYKKDIIEVYEDIKFLIAGRKTKNLKIEIVESKEEKENG